MGSSKSRDVQAAGPGVSSGGTASPCGQSGVGSGHRPPGCGHRGVQRPRGQQQLFLGLSLGVSLMESVK